METIDIRLTIYLVSQIIPQMMIKRFKYEWSDKTFEFKITDINEDALVEGGIDWLIGGGLYLLDNVTKLKDTFYYLRLIYFMPYIVVMFILNIVLHAIVYKQD